MELIMIFSAHQPNYFPYLGLFYKIYKSDYFVFLDDVQFTKSSGPAHDRNILFDGNKIMYLKVPIKYHFKDKINEVKINNSIDWVNNHISKMSACYSKAPFFETVMNEIRPLLSFEYSNLAELNIAIIKHICNRSGIGGTFVKSSSYNCQRTKTDRLIELGKNLGCDVYYSGNGAKGYMNCEKMENEGIKVVFSDYIAAAYTTNGILCKANMSVLDFLFYYGYDFSVLGWEKNEKRVIDIGF